MNIEKLNLWDRLFNRTRKEVIGRGEERWHNVHYGYTIPNSTFERSYVDYKITDRVTGSEAIKRVYLN